ncbi:hypothetical protein Scep_001673 [Stephania cephalantha]|uniref:Uncharacterized protein n=1 Tax=Stephania cephalantha TaxID=152367 RepID=A0AAP0L8F5_9MAGN
MAMDSAAAVRRGVRRMKGGGAAAVRRELCDGGESVREKRQGARIPSIEGDNPTTPRPKNVDIENKDPNKFCDGTKETEFLANLAAYRQCASTGRTKVDLAHIMVSRMLRASVDSMSALPYSNHLGKIFDIIGPALPTKYDNGRGMNLIGEASLLKMNYELINGKWVVVKGQSTHVHRDDGGLGGDDVNLGGLEEQINTREKGLKEDVIHLRSVSSGVEMEAAK